MQKQHKWLRANWPLLPLAVGFFAIALGYVPMPFVKRDGNYKQVLLGAFTFGPKDPPNLGEQRAIASIAEGIRQRHPLMPPVFQPTVDGVRVQWEEVRSSKHVPPESEYLYRRIRYSARFEILEDTKYNGNDRETMKYSGVTPEIFRKFAARFGDQVKINDLTAYGCKREVFKN